MGPSAALGHHPAPKRTRLLPTQSRSYISAERDRGESALLYWQHLCMRLSFVDVTVSFYLHFHSISCCRPGLRTTQRPWRLCACSMPCCALLGSCCLTLEGLIRILRNLCAPVFLENLARGATGEAWPPAQAASDLQTCTAERNRQAHCWACADRSAEQKWELMEACLLNLELWLRAVKPEAAALPEPLSIPGLSIIVDVLGKSLP